MFHCRFWPRTLAMTHRRLCWSSRRSTKSLVSSSGLTSAQVRTTATVGTSTNYYNISSVSSVTAYILWVLTGMDGHQDLIGTQWHKQWSGASGFLLASFVFQGSPWWQEKQVSGIITALRNSFFIHGKILLCWKVRGQLNISKYCDVLSLMAYVGPYSLTVRWSPATSCWWMRSCELECLLSKVKGQLKKQWLLSYSQGLLCTWQLSQHVPALGTLKHPRLMENLL